jgi:hypothetical protein
MMEIPTSLE